MSEDAQIRRANLKALGHGPSELSVKLGSSVGYWSALMSGSKSFGEKAARSIEEKLDLPRGWLDAEHGDAPAEIDRPTPHAAPPALTLAQALPVVLAHLPGLSEYRAGQVIQALQAAARSAAPLDQIERDLLQWLTEPRTAAPASAAPGAANRAAA